MHSQSITGAGIGIAVLDTGIYPHIDFDRRIIAFRDFTARHSLIPYDDNGHGTHIAGILGTVHMWPESLQEAENHPEADTVAKLREVI